MINPMACPFCDSEDVQINHTEVDGRYAGSCITCLECGATGPEEATTDNACAAWNRPRLEHLLAKSITPAAKAKEAEKAEIVEHCKCPTPILPNPLQEPSYTEADAHGRKAISDSICRRCNRPLAPKAKEADDAL